MARPLPILLLVRELTIGGCERDLTRLAVHLDRERFEPHAGCFQAAGMRGDELRAAGVPTVEFPVRSLVSPVDLWRGWRKLTRYLRANRIVLVQSFDVPMNIFAVPVAKMAGVPVLLASQLSFRDLYTWRERHALRLVDMMADRLVVNSQAVERDLWERERVPRHLTFVCHNGVDTSIFKPQPGPRPEPLREASLVIGTVCALREEKRLELLLEAFAQVRGAAPGMKLLIVGSGAEEPKIRARAGELGLGGDTVFVPSTPRVDEWLRSIDIFVLSSRSESFPNALLEAMACGCAAVASNVGGIPELILDGRTGLLFEPENAGDLAGKLRELISDDALRRTLREEGRCFAHENFSAERNATRMQDLYTQLLRERGIAA